jgi:hypothetical protein
MSYVVYRTVQEIPDASELMLCVTVIGRSLDVVRRSDLDGKDSHRRRQ